MWAAGGEHGEHRRYPTMAETPESRLFTLDTTLPVWDRFFLASPLVVIGTREDDGSIDLAPKHMGMPLGWGNYFGFICTPRHATYRNIHERGDFTVSFPRPEQIVSTSLTSVPRTAEGIKPSLQSLPTRPATIVDGVFLSGCYLYFECELDRMVDGFGENSLVAGWIVAAHVAVDALRSVDRDDQALLSEAPLPVFLYPDRYGTIDRSVTFPYHEGFER